MKKIVSFIMSAVIAAVCVQTAPIASTVESNILVVYFSATGTTKAVAENISSVLGADIYEILPTVPYTSADLSYNNDCRANREQNDDSARPEILGQIENIDKYDAIFIGYPIWWGKLPKIIYTFLESYDLSEKTIIPFCTSGGSGISTSVNEIKSLEPNAAVNDGRRLNGATKDSIKTWTDELNLPEAKTETGGKPEIKIENNAVTVTGAPDNSTLILAFYKNNALVDVITKKGGNTITQSIPETDADKVKGFLWDMKTITPLVPEIQLKTTTPPQSYDTVYIHANENSLPAALSDNESAAALVEILKQHDIEISMSDYGGFEKVGTLSFSLPKNDVQMTTEPGDLILYNGNQLTIHYGNNSWSYTKLAKIENMTGEELKNALGGGDVTVTLSLNE